MKLNLHDAVAKRTWQLMKERNMTQYRLGKLSGITHGGLDGLLNGTHKNVTLSTVYRLARGFGMTFHEFVDDDVFRSAELEID